MMAAKHNIIFICQITETLLKIIKFQVSTRAVLGVQVQPLGAGADLALSFQKLGYAGHPVIVSFPRSQATCRYLKVPAQSPEEIENIAALQAARFLPYPIEELITGFQQISIDKEGYAYINLIIAHKDAVWRYLKALEPLKPVKVSLILSSYGLVNFYNSSRPKESEAVLIVDIDDGQAELAVASEKKLLFSRALRFNVSSPEWKNLLIEEISRSRDAYLKELSLELPPRKIILTGAKKFREELQGILGRQGNLSIEVLSYPDANLPQGHSFTHLLGFGAAKIEGHLNLLPKELKQELKSGLKRKEQVKLISFILAVILVFGLATVKNFDNKARYLKRLKQELNKIAKEVKPLEEIEKRLSLTRSRSQNKPVSSEILYTLHQVTPETVSLSALIYEEDKELILRGQAPELGAVFDFVAQLEKSPTFKRFNIKVRYATKKKILGVEVADFEIACLKK